MAKYLPTEGLEIRSVLTLVQQDVYDDSGGAQLPYVESGLPRMFFAATATGPLPERERLLLAMADVTPAIRDQVEKTASTNDMPLAPLYGALISADLANLDTEDRESKLNEAALAFVKTREDVKAATRLSSSRPAGDGASQAGREQPVAGCFCGSEAGTGKGHQIGCRRPSIH